MRTKETKIDAIVERTRQILESTELLQSFKITISGSINEVTSIVYNIDEVVKDWSDEDDTR